MRTKINENSETSNYYTAVTRHSASSLVVVVVWGSFLVLFSVIFMGFAPLERILSGKKLSSLKIRLQL